MSKVYRFGIIGCGTIAQIHARAIQSMERAEIAGVYDPVQASAQAFARQHACAVYATLDQMLADPTLDVVNICTPSSTHAELAVAAARAGKHVVVEKPLAIHLEDAQAVVQAQEETGVQICVISQLRFSPDVQALHDALAQQAFGRLVLGSLSMRYSRSEEYYRNGGWRGRWATDGGGALMNQGIHGLDLLCYLCGPVKRVHAEARTLLHSIEVEDTLCATLEFENGGLGVLEVSTAIRPGHARRIEISGTAGSATLTEDSLTEWECEAPRPQTHDRWQMNSANDPAAVDAAGHRLQLENLLAAMEGRETLLVDARQGRDTVAVILAMYESARTGKIVTLGRECEGDQ